MICSFPPDLVRESIPAPRDKNSLRERLSVAAGLHIRGKVFCGTAEIQHGQGLPVFRDPQNFLRLDFIKTGDPDAARIQAGRFQRHVSGSGRGVGRSDGIAALRVCPAGSPIIADEELEWSTEIEIDYAFFLDVTLFGKVHVLLITAEGAELSDLLKALRHIQDQDALGLQIDCGR